MASVQSRKINPSRFHHSQLKFLIPLAIMGTAMVLPIVFIFTTAFKPAEELFIFPPAFFVVNPTFDNFRELFDMMAALGGVPASRYFINSIVIAVLTVVLSVLLSVSAGYILSKKNFRFRNLLFEINTLALMFVPIAVTIPRFIIIVRLGLIDNFFANILPIVSMPIGLFLLKQFIDQVPDALIEAARIDGAGEFKILFTVIIPMTMPAIATVAILSFQSAWGNVEASIFYLNDESLKSFAYFMTTLNVGGAGTPLLQGVAAASTLIMFVPNLIIFIVMQSKVMNTMAHSGIK